MVDRTRSTEGSQESLIQDLVEEHPHLQPFVEHALLLGPAVFTPTRTDNVHTLSNKRDLTLLQALQVVVNSEQYTNLKYKLLDEKHRLLKIDVDDHSVDATENFERFCQVFRIPEGAVRISTPSGKGFHIDLLAPNNEDITKGKFNVPGFDGIDILYDVPSNEQRYVLAGSQKNGTPYVLKGGDLRIYRGPLISALVTQSKTADTEAKLRIEEFERLGGKIDSRENVMAVRRYLSDLQYKIMDGELEPISEGQRDDRFWQIACNVFERGVSKERGYNELLKGVFNNSTIYPDEPKDQALFDRCVHSAWARVSRLRNMVSKAAVLETWERDDNGNVDITHEEMEAKLDFLLEKNIPQRLSQTFRPLTTETIFKDSDTGNYMVPNRLPYEHYVEEYNFTTSQEDAHPHMDINFFGPLNIMKKTRTHWQLMMPKQVNEIYKVPNGNKREKPLTQFPGFHTNVLYARIHEVTSHGHKGYIYRNGQAFINTYDTFPELKPEEYELVREEVDEVESILFKYVIADDDVDQFRMRLGIVLQHPRVVTPNIPVFFSPNEGSGKSILIDLFFGMFPEEKSVVHTNINEANERFSNNLFLTSYDDVNLDKIKDINQIKSEATVRKRKDEVKYVQARYVDEPVNIFFSTNNAPTRTQFFIGRRWTIYVNDKPFSLYKRQEEIREVLRRLKADHYRLYRGLKYKWMNTDLSEYDPYYKTQYQKDLYGEMVRGARIIPFLVTAVHNLGHVSPERQVFVPGEYVNRYDILILDEHYRRIREGIETDPSEYHTATIPARTQIRSLFNFPTQSESLHYYQEWKEIFTDPNDGKRAGTITEASRISNTVKRTFCNLVPEWRDTIRLIAKMDTGSDRGIQQVIDKYHLKDIWDGNLPTENLGNIDPYALYDIEIVPDEEETW